MFRFFSLITYLCVSLPWAASLPDGFKPIPVRDIGSRIINGEEAENGQFPWQVAIMARSSSIPRYLCGGSLISEEWVLTAGHCVDGTISATIYAGSARMHSSDTVTRHSSVFVQHKDFDPITLRNDIGLIRLETPLTLSENIQPIVLAEEELEASTTVTVSGWGSISDYDPEPYSHILNYISVSTIENTECSRIYGSQVVYPGLVCTSTGTPLKSPCLGDSGGPVVANVDTDPVLVGIFSFVNGYGCEFSFPAGNTRTAYYREWIRDQTGV